MRSSDFFALVLIGSFAIGFVVRRWWIAVVVGVGVGIYIAITARVEIDHAFFGLLAGLFVCLPMLVGVGLSQLLRWNEGRVGKGAKEPPQNLESDPVVERVESPPTEGAEHAE